MALLLLLLLRNYYYYYYYYIVPEAMARYTELTGVEAQRHNVAAVGPHLETQKCKSIAQARVAPRGAGGTEAQQRQRGW